jgi:hypothetical protein
MRGAEVNFRFDDEAAARAMVDRIKKTSVGAWRDITEAVRRSNRRHTD